MKITLSQFAGFCDGVRRAYEIVSELDMATVKQPVFVLGSLVHNSDVVKKIEEKGILKIDLESFIKSKVGEIGTLIITAHGVGPNIYAVAKEKNINLIDTTCPKVIKVQRLAQIFVKRGYTVVVVGDRQHKEVRSIFEWGAEKPVIVSDDQDLENIELSQAKRIIILSQTTQSKEFVERVSNFIENKYEKVERIDTICLATNQRQGEIQELARENDAVVVIGSPESANSTMLYEIAKKINKNVVFIERADALDKNFFKEIESVAVTAGASTPSWIITAVIEKLKEC